MEILIKRVLDDRRATVGHLYVDGVLFCVTLEDTFRHSKIDRETRIPAGRYEIKLRKNSPMAHRYKERYGTDGMLWLQSVDGFKYVYVHIGNTSEDTEGCILVGSEIRQRVDAKGLESIIVESTGTYKKLHETISSEKSAFVTIVDN